VIAFSSRSMPELVELTRQLQALGVQVDIVPRLFEALGPNVSINSIEEVQLVSLPPPSLSPGAHLLKRGFDVLVASVILLLIWPLYLAIALWIKLDSAGPVLFRQTRLGLDGRPFTMLKFRTMREGTSHESHRAYIERAMDSRALPEAGGVYKLDRGDSITRSGRWLRRTSVDELPQLINVLRGDMSLVGPRPCIPYETEHFQPHHFERFSVPAGITGLWQVKSRGRATFGEALEMDVAYARGWSFGLDMLLLLQTPLQLFRPSTTK
jgi:lipopolysaccharide/colanic/teichoic acid biosynthesis glycosyltransferase